MPQQIIGVIEDVLVEDELVGNSSEFVSQDHGPVEPCELESGEVIEDRFVGEWQERSPVVLEAGGMNYDPVVEGVSGAVVEGGSGEVVEGGSGEVVEGGSGEVVEGGSGEVVEGGSGEVVEGGSGEVVEDGSGEGDGMIQRLREKVSAYYPQLGLEQFCIAPCQMTLQAQPTPVIRSSQKSWDLVYPALTFMMNGQLFAEYSRVTGMLG